MKNLIFGLAFLLAAIPCEARIITVDDNGPADFTNIQAAINGSNDGDTIQVYPGIYYENVYFYGKTVTLISIDPNDANIVSQTVIDGDRADSVVTFAWGENFDSVIRGFTITNGQALYGGGICCWSTSPTIENCIITGNLTGDGDPGGYGDGYGGGIYGCNGNISNCYIIDNFSGRDGGGLYNCNGIIKNCVISKNITHDFGIGGGLASCSGSIINCLIEDNSAARGGGLTNCNGIITNCIVNNNVATGSGQSGYGGGFSKCNGQIIGCVICNNESNDYGGGLYNCGGTILDCLVSGNRSRLGGAGLSGCNGTISNCVISGNMAGSDGGGIYNCNAQIKNCTITGNLTSGIGGGIYFDIGFQPRIKNNVVVSNVSGGGIYWKYAVPTEFSYNNVCGNAGGNYTGWATPGIGDISVDPCFVSVGYWSDPCNTPGDVSDDIWMNGDYHLKSQAGRWKPNSQQWVYDEVTSPCIDAGNPGYPVGDEPAPNGNRINMGAYGGTNTASKSPAYWHSIADLTNDWAVDFNDLKVFVDYWLETGECIPSDLNRNQLVNLSDFAIFADNWLWP